VLLAAVVIVLAVAAGVRERVVPGDPTALPVPAAPQEGDCIQENPLAIADLFPVTGPLPALRNSGCAGRRFGEVVSVGAGQADGVEVPMVAVEQCFRQAFAYLGLPALPPVLDLPTGPAVAVQTALIGPDDRQRAAGQDWAACVVLLPIAIDADETITVDHSLRGAWDRPEDSRLFSVCLHVVSTMMAGANCSVPHRFELISFRLGDPAQPAEAAESECLRDVVEAIGSSAALDRGELSVVVVPARPDPKGDRLIIGADAVTADTGYVNHCLIEPADAAKRLTGSVRRLMDAPLPLN